MILKETTIITLKRKSDIHKWEKMGYSVLSDNTVSVKISDLSKGSNYKIPVKCEVCGKEKIISYKSYNESKKTGQYTCCSKCSRNKVKENNLERYGVENVSEIKEVRDKAKKTNLERYGTENYLQSKEGIEKIKKTNLERYGVENVSEIKEIRDKAKKTMLKKYGADSYSKTEDFKIKYKKTNMERYGCEYPLQNKKILNKTKKTNIERYGTEHVLQNEDIKSKSKKTCLKKYGVERYSKTDEYLEKVKKTKMDKYGSENYVNRDKYIETMTKKYGVDNIFKDKEFIEINKHKRKPYIHKKNEETVDKYTKLLDDIYEIKSLEKSIFHIYHKDCCEEFYISRKHLYDRLKISKNICTKCKPIGDNSSILENDIFDIITKYTNNIIKNDRKILEGKELDIYLPEFNLAIEFNGLYWHSEIYKDKNYHLEKSLECKGKGIELIHIFEDDWINKREIIKSILLNKINKISNKLYARKCIIKEVKSDKAREFLDTNHIQGFSRSKYKLGLYYNDELVSLMTFGYRKTNSKKEFELIRFCNKLNTSVVGSASKLFKYFIKNYKIEEDYILSYADISMFNGDLYNRLGFNYIHRSKPNYFWVVDNKREHRWKYNKQNLIKEGFDSSMTEVEIMHSRGSYRIYGCGQDRYEYSII